jgi:organic hydroperoxide reductase OsmC/OhrA
MVEQGSFGITLTQVRDFEFNVKFDLAQIPELAVDEAPPVGEAAGPNPDRLLAVAVAHCLSSSLLFCLRKFKQDGGGIIAEAAGTLVRNERGRLRIGRLDVVLRLGLEAGAIEHFERCAAQFEDFCIVTASIRQGIPVGVKVVDATGATVFEGGH